MQEFDETKVFHASDIHSMDTRAAITSRKSIRKYTGEPVSEELIHTVLNAGFCAPSAHNRRPWHFVVIKNRETLHALADAYRYSKMLKCAALCIAVCERPGRAGFSDCRLQRCHREHAFMRAQSRSWRSLDWDHK